MSTMIQEPDYMKKLESVISEAKKQIILPEYQDKVSDNEVLGVLVAKFSKWSFENIVEVTKSALEDSNFRNVELMRIEN